MHLSCTGSRDNLSKNVRLWSNIRLPQNEKKKEKNESDIRSRGFKSRFNLNFKKPVIKKHCPKGCAALVCVRARVRTCVSARMCVCVCVRVRASALE